MGCSPLARRESGMTERLTLTLTVSDKPKNSTRSQDSSLSRVTSQPACSCSSLPRVSLTPRQPPSLSREETVHS